MIRRRMIGAVFDGGDLPLWLYEHTSDVYRAPQGLLTDEGHFAIRLSFQPDYASTDPTGDTHTILDFGSSASLLFDGDSSTFVLRVDGIDLSSDAVTFASSDELTIDVEHTDARRRIRVRGAASGDCRIDDEPMPPTAVESMVYVLGQKTGTTWTATLTALRPIYSDTFAELADVRMLSAVDPSGTYRALASVIAIRKGRIHDVALTMRDALDREHAVGEALDVIGSIVGLPRHGFSDERYQTFLGIQIELLLSRAREELAWTGTAPNLIGIVRQFVGAASAGAVRYAAYPPKSYTITVEDLDYDEAFLLRRFLNVATWAEVLGLIQVELGSEKSMQGSDALTVTNEGKQGDTLGTVSDAMIQGTVIPVGV